MKIKKSKTKKSRASNGSVSVDTKRPGAMMGKLLHRVPTPGGRSLFGERTVAFSGD